MSRIGERFESLKKANQKALVAFITAGDPDLATTQDMFKVIEESGADLIELGVPFSDPLADGPVIQASSQRSLKAGTSLKKIIELVKEIRKDSQLPIVLMTSFNPVWVYGQDKFVTDASAAGVDGLIIPDLPPEEAGEFYALASAQSIDVIYLLAPTSTPDRIEMISSKSRGFIYYVSITGVTGTKSGEEGQLAQKVGDIKKVASQPVLVGFGISGPEQAKAASEISDGVIVGSAIVKIIDQCTNAEDRRQKVGVFVQGIKQALNGN